MDTEYKGFSFFFNLLNSGFLLDQIFKDYLQSIIVKDDTESYRYWWQAIGNRKLDSDFCERKTSTLKSSGFIEFLYLIVDRQKKELEYRILRDISYKTELNEQLDILRLQLKTAHNLIISCEVNERVASYSGYLVNCLREIGQFCIETSKRISFGVSYFEEYYLLFHDDLSTSKSIETVKDKYLMTIPDNYMPGTGDFSEKVFMTYKRNKKFEENFFRDIITHLFLLLKKRSFIDDKTSEVRFLSIFGLGDRNPTPIIWRKTNASLKELINFMYNDLLDSRVPIWEATGNCFTGINKDGEMVSYLPIDKTDNKGKKIRYGQYNPIGGAKDTLERPELESLLTEYRRFLKTINE